jgi:hypothetical protein
MQMKQSGRLQSLRSAQSYLNAAQSATQRYYALRASLIRDHMAPIAKFAAVLLRDTPELEPFALPRGKPSAERLKALAIGMAQAAEPFARAFTDAGLPANFIAPLEIAADAMVEPVIERKASRVARRGATQGLATLLSRGRKTVQVLDALVKSAVKDDPAMVAAWGIAKRVERVASETARRFTGPKSYQLVALILASELRVRQYAASQKRRADG